MPVRKAERGHKVAMAVSRVLVVAEKEDVSKAVKSLKLTLLEMCNAKSVDVVAKLPKGEFSEAESAYGKVCIDKALDKELMEEAMVKEVVREVQLSRKKNGYQIGQKIALHLSSDKETGKLLDKHKNAIMEGVGASKIQIGVLAGKNRSSVKFDDKMIEIAFE